MHMDEDQDNVKMDTMIFDSFFDIFAQEISPLPLGHLLTMGYMCAHCNQPFKVGDHVIYPLNEFIVHKNCS